MAKYRSIQTSFWSDSKIVDDFTPEDRYFYLYLLTNEKSNQLGCYEISKNQMCRDTGYNIESIEKLLQRFEDIHDVIVYDNKTKEIFIKNWHKYNWLNSWKTKVCIDKEFDNVKSQKIINEISPMYAPYMPQASNNNKNKKKNKNKKDILSSKLDDTNLIFSEIINCFNKVGIKEESFTKNKVEFHFKNTKNNQKLIEDVLNNGYSKDDIMDVIYLKYDQWIENNDKNKKDMSTYYRPSTILGEKFEEYLEEAKMKGIS
jgi:uncharacterized phage protein (TIGR02220 family)